MIRRLLATTAIGLGLAALCAQPAHAVDDVFIFGDSLSDNGNLFAATMGTNPASPPNFDGRFSNGPTYAELFPGLIGATGTTTNLAYGGAQTGTGMFDVRTIVGNFVGAPPPGIGADDLFVIFAGANDYFNNLPPIATNSGAIQALINTTVTNIVTAMGTLAAVGAKNFLIVNLPDLGSTPAVQAQGAATAAGFNQVVGFHNAALQQGAEGFAAANGLTVQILDVNSLLKDVLANPGTYGFTNTTIPCLSMIANGPATGACPNAAAEDATVFWDPIHPTAASHEVFANFILGSLQAKARAGATVAAQGQAPFFLAKATGQAINTRLYNVRVNGNGGVAMLGNSFGGPQLADAQGLKGLDFDDRQQVAEAGSWTNPDSKLGIFMFGNYGTGDRDAKAGQAGFDYDTWLLSLGLDYRVDEHLVIGFMGGYGNTETDLDAGAGHAEIDSWTVAAYAGVSFGGFYGDFSAAYSFDDHDEITRATGFALTPTATASTEGDTWSVSANGGYAFPVTDQLNIGPTAGFRYAETNIDGYSETGGGALNLTFPDQTADSFIIRAGVELSGNFEVGGGQLSPNLRLVHETEAGNDARRINASTASGTTVQISTADGDDSYFVIGGGAQYQMDGLTIIADYEGSLDRDDGQDHLISGKVQLQF